MIPADVDLQQIRAHYHVPEKLQACHTAIVDGYVIEGHVPVADIKKLLKERPDAVGLSAPHMPIGSPGMEIEGFKPQAYKVFLFKKDGTYEVYHDYPHGGP